MGYLSATSGFERVSYHALNVADALEGVVKAAVELLDEVRLEVLALGHVLLRVHVVSGSEKLR